MIEEVFVTGPPNERNQSLIQQMILYYQTSHEAFWLAVAEHCQMSLLVLLVAAALGLPLGFLSVRYRLSRRLIVPLFQVLRIIPSLAVLMLLIPIMGVGALPAMTALTLLALPPILMNTIAGLEDVPDFMLETASACGMSESQVWWKVRIPLAMPLILTGLKTAAVEIIASATLAAKIGAGGIGGIIFTGLGLYRTDLLLIGGASVALLSLTAGLLFEGMERWLMPYRRR